MIHLDHFALFGHNHYEAAHSRLYARRQDSDSTMAARWELATPIKSSPSVAQITSK